MNNRIIEGLVPPSRDLYSGFANYLIWTTFAWHDIKQRYRRSKLGPFWFVLNNVIFIVALGSLYSQIFGQDVSRYIPYLAGGFIAWQFIASSLSEGSTCIVENGNLVKQVNVPLSVYPLRVITRNFIILLHNLPVMILFPIIYGIDLGIELLIVPVSLILYFFNSLWVSIILGTLGARYRDVQPLMQNIVTIAFFVTPIMWVSDLLNDRVSFVQLNPFFHFISIVRSPLMGEMPSLLSFGVVIFTTIVGNIAAWFCLKSYRDNVAYWL